MAIYSRELLSGSVQGRGVLINATATPGTLIHTTGTSATTKDEVWIYAYNSSTASVELTMECGGATAPNDNVKINVPAKAGLTLVLPGNTYTGSGTVGLEIRAFAATTNVIVISGYVNRAT